MAKRDLLDTLVKLREEMLIEFLFHRPDNPEKLLDEIRDTQSRMWWEVAKGNGIVLDSMQKVFDGTVNEVQIPRYLTDKEVERLQKRRALEAQKKDFAANSLMNKCLAPVRA